MRHNLWPIYVSCVHESRFSPELAVTLMTSLKAATNTHAEYRSIQTWLTALHVASHLQVHQRR